jgi:hypothetical protein
MLEDETNRGWIHRRNSEPLGRLAVALQEGKVFVVNAHGRLVRVPAGAWKMLTLAIGGGLLTDQSAGCRIADDVDLQNPQLKYDPLTALEVAVLRLNHRQQLATGCPDAVVRSCRQVHDPIVLRRHPLNELQFVEFIAALGRLLYDGTNGVTSVQDRGAVKPTLPSWCYRDHRSVIVHVIVLRNYYLHALSPNKSTAEEHLASAGDVFQLYGAKRVPDDLDFAAIRIRMLDAATRLINRLAARVPVRNATAAAVFTGSNGDGEEECFSSPILPTNLEESEQEELDGET